MTPFDLWALRFLLASVGCMVAGAGVWAVTALCRRYLPAVAMQRTMWLLGLATVVGTFLVILVPHSERLRLVPPIELSGATEAHSMAADARAAAAPALTAGAAPRAAAAELSWLALGARAWLALYLLGLGYSVIRLLHSQRMLGELAAAGWRVTALHQHAGFATALGRASTAPVFEVDAPISPMLFGLFRPRLLLPRHLRNFDVIQQQMIVTHELTHLRRHDLQWMGAGAFLQTLLWFNPFMRLLRANLSWAQELGCDRDVLHGRPGAERKAYAAALVAQLKLQHRAANTALAFGGVSVRTVAARVALIREPAATAWRTWARCATIGGLAAVFAGSLALQPALAWDTLSAHETMPAVPGTWLAPFEQPALLTAINCTELADAATGARLVHEGECDERVTPASTFNIVVSLMGYDSGILVDEHAPALPFKEGYADWNPAWRVTTDPTTWIMRSVLWYAQQVTARLGATRFQRYVQSFDYGNHDVSGDSGKENGLSLSWVSSSLKISPVEQVQFLRRVVNRNLPLTPHAYDTTTRLLKLQTLPGGWEIYGKTGTASPVLPDGRDDRTRAYGWFVGWATKGQRTVVFARLVLEPAQEGSAAGPRAREAFLRDLPARLESL
jgi:bla regulator protein BlaR1